MKILGLDSRLTTIKSLGQAFSVLQEVRRQGAPLSFSTSETTRAVFRAVEDGVSTDFTIWEPDSSTMIPKELQPTIRMSEWDTARYLYRRRKHFNEHWRG